MLRRLIYISRSLIGDDPIGIEYIVSHSERTNARVRVTGMLWAEEGKFAQVLEGEPNEVKRVMNRIRNDRRHTDIVVLLDRAATSRQFETWSMRRGRDDEASSRGTAFMIGFAMSNRTEAARQLYEIVLASSA